MRVSQIKLCIAAVAASALALVSAANGVALDHDAAQALLDRYVQAIGGTAAIDAIRTRVTVYEVSFGWRINGTLEVRQMRPDHVVERGTGSGWGWHGEFSQGFDGTAGWSKAPEERLHALEGRGLQQYLLRSRLDRDAHLNELYPTQVVRPDLKIKDRMCHVVKLTSRFGTREIWYLDSLTGLLVQIETEPDDDVGSRAPAAITTFDDYRFVDAVRIPFRVTHQYGKRRYAMTVTAIHNNVHLTSEDFAISK
jgi:hypothetical protein